VGTGFSQGTPNITVSTNLDFTQQRAHLQKDEVGLAQQLVGFFEQFLDVFSELKGKKLYLTGESYAGQYVPCAYIHVP
jgi:carboxypeptidase D